MRTTTYAALASACSIVVLASQVAAQTTEDDGKQSPGDIIVTATKRGEAIQDVSMAISAIGGDALQSGGVRNLEDLQALVPSLTIGDDFNVAKVFMRGVGTNTSVAGSEAGVALHVDGAVVARPEAQLTSLYDLERVEVLRGPQGTLYGRNAVGGAVNLITAKPTDHLSGYGRLTYGNYQRLDLEGAIGGPITDWLSARIAAKSEARGGFGVNPTTGSDVNDVNRQMARLHLFFTPSDKFDMLLTGEYFRQKDASGTLQYGGPAFPNPNGGPPLWTPPGAGGFPPNPRDTAGDYDPFVRSKGLSITNTANWYVNDWLTITNITNYRDFETIWGQDLDLSAIESDPVLTGFSRSTIARQVGSEPQYSNELQIKTDSEWVKGVFGAFYFHEDMHGATQFGGDGPFIGVDANAAIIAGSGLDPLELLRLCGIEGLAFTPRRADGLPNPVNNFCGESEHETDAWAIFGQYNVDLGMLSPSLDAFTVKIGGRYSSEERSVYNPAVIMAAPTPIVLTGAGVSNTRKFDRFTPELGLEWQPNRDLLVYYTYSEGFKSGVGELIPASAVIVGPETIKNHEFGIKSAWFDRRLILNLAAFTYDLKGLQISKSLAADNGIGFVQRFENAASVEATGVEGDFSFSATDDLRFHGNVAYLDSTFADFTTADPLDPVNIVSPAMIGSLSPIVQLAGNPTRNSPKWSGSLGVEYDWRGLQLPAEGFLTFRGDVSYKDDVYFSEFARFLEGQEAYTLVDASVEYSSPNNGFTASLWGKNLSDELVRGGSFALVTNGVMGVTYLPPRTYGFSVGYKF